MLPDPIVEDIVLFELPSPLFAQRLLEHVGCERFAWHVSERWVPQVAVALMSEDLDLAHVLRDVQCWLAVQGLTWIHFELDGRAYVLKSTELAQVAS
ncbi:MAG TPA: hypothetical protein VKA45_11085 [Gaiellaceae bacterium]|nr:hypothetical protein [Gaiellaceae bacterium]